MDQEIERILAHSEIRATSDPLLKAVFIKVRNNLGYRRVAAYLNITRSALRRAVKAHQEGRNLGVNGHPPIVQPQDEMELEKIIQTWKTNHGEDISH